MLFRGRDPGTPFLEQTLEEPAAALLRARDAGDRSADMGCGEAAGPAL